MRVDDFDSDDCSSAVPVSVSRSSLKLTLSRITRPARADAADSGRVRKASRGHRSLGPRKERQYIGRFPQEIEPWTHLVTSSPPVTRQPPPLWEDRTGNFFQRLPVSEDEWSRKRTRAGLTNEADLLRVYDQVCGRQSNGHTASPGAGTEGAGKKLDLSGLVKTYSSISVAGKLRQIIDQLLYRTFLATCIVASKQGCNLEDVDRAHRQYLEACGKSNDKGDNTLRRERATVLWELQEQQRQFRRGLLHRGFEIFIIGRWLVSLISQYLTAQIEGRDLSFSIKCPKKPEENAEFTKKIPLCEVPVEFQASLPLWIPIFVKFRNYSEWRYVTHIPSISPLTRLQLLDYLSGSQGRSSQRRVTFPRIRDYV